RLGCLTLHQKANDAACAVDTAPMIARNIKAHEKVIRKQRSKNTLCLAGMPHCLAVTRAERSIVLPFKLAYGLVFSVALRLHNIPACSDDRVVVARANDS